VSYLGPLRLHFAGRFQAAVSTVNNDPKHYDNAKFVPSDQEPSGPGGRPPNGWWNPRGDADWRLIGCDVTSAWLADGSAVTDDDPVLAATVADSDRLAPTKLVDLDPCQQLVSTIWGLEMRIADRQGSTLLRGTYEPAAFFDIWIRATEKGDLGDISACAMYQSVLKGVSWGDVSGSPFLSAMRAATPDGILSVKFSVDGYNMSFGDPEFTRGRIVGTIGPSSPVEPEHMVIGRQLAARAGGSGGMFVPADKVNFCTAVVDETAAKVYLDLGNALPTTKPGGEMAKIGKLSLHAGDQVVCPVPYSSDGWYARTAGIVALPADRPLSAAELHLVAESPLSLWVDGSPHAAVTETPNYVRADAFVFRCNPAEPAKIRIYASHLGKPSPHTEVKLRREVSHLQPPPGTHAGTPEGAISFPSSAMTNADGLAQVTVDTSDPGKAREFIDGQVYGIRPMLADSPATPVDWWNFVSLLVWSDFVSANPPTWRGDLQPIFQQYANLYPIMQDFLDLSDYEEVCANQKLLLLAFDLDVADPNSMPVTRDLSTKKRKAILSWLKNPGADGKPLLGEAPPPQPRVTARPEATLPDSLISAKGGKTAAAARRLIVTRETH
jgi:hypothetical protein